MKSEKEFVILLKLIDSPFNNGLFSKKHSMTKIALEKYLKFSENNKDFRNWLDYMIKIGCIEVSGEENKGVGRNSKVFIINESLTIKKLKENTVYKDVAKPFFTNRAFFNAIFD